MQINVDENVFKVYAISIAILMAKTLIMALLTARQRFKHMVRAQAHSISMIESLFLDNCRGNCTYKPHFYPGICEP